MDDWLLKLEEINVDFLRDGTYHPAVCGLDYRLLRGRTLGIVGESGSGKSVSSMSLMGLLPPPPLCRVSGRALFRPLEGDAPVDLLSLSEDDLRRYRGRHLSMIFQEPMTSLNPVQKCGPQVVEMLCQHEDVPRREARQRVLDLFNEVRLPRPEKLFSSYPHEISGGQKQRVMIAMALICHPHLLIADEPTTALDVTVQKAILDLLRSLQQKHQISIIFITHDLAVVAQIADDVAVMYQGHIVEQGPAAQVLHHPSHPYTQGLLACRPPLQSRPRRLPTVADFLQGATPEPLMPTPAPSATTPPSDRPLLTVRDLQVTFPLQKNLFGKVTKQLKAVDGVSFDIYRGETLGLVGESGCGKSTLGRALLRLLEHSAGSIVYDGHNLDHLSRVERRELRQRVQIIFQDPYSSLNPRLTVGEAILEPLRCHRLLSSDRLRRSRVEQLLQQVGLPSDAFNRYPHEFSGGQRQRVCIARALALQPEMVVCDESVSALDVSVQAQVLNLLNDLKAQYGYTYLFITHDLSVVKFLSDRIMVMEQGRLVELAPSDDLFAHPKQPYTRRLLDALPRIS